MSPSAKSKLLLVPLALVALLVLPAAAGATLAYVKYGHYPLAPAVFTADDDGADELYIGRGVEPEVSPDGDFVAYLNKRGSRERLKVAHTYGGALDLLIEAARISSLAWSPESTRIAAVRAPANGRERLVLIDVPSGGQHVIARGYFGRVSFSPNGDQLVYSRFRKGAATSTASRSGATAPSASPTTTARRRRCGGRATASRSRKKWGGSASSRSTPWGSTAVK